MEAVDPKTSRSSRVNGSSYYHTGDLGDIVASLASIRGSTGNRYFIGEMPGGQRESLRGGRFDILKPLIESQPYIESCSWTDMFPAPSWKNFSTFRNNYHYHENLALQQARHIGIHPCLDPWLTLSVEPLRKSSTVICRTTRYLNSQFPWRRILDHFQDKVFVGLPQEHAVFQNQYREIGFHPCKDILELARVIAGADMLVSNQTCAWWIAAGLGKSAIQETFLPDQNSVIERSNLWYSRNAEEINALLNSL